MTRLRKVLGDFETRIAYVLVILLTVLLSVQIVNRYVFHISFVWLEEIARIGFVWLIYFAVASAARTNSHIRIEVIDLFVPPSVVRAITYIADALVIAFSLVVVWLGVLVMQSSIRFGDTSPVTEIPMWLVYAVIPICFALIALRVFNYDLELFRSGRNKPHEVDGHPPLPLE